MATVTTTAMIIPTTAPNGISSFDGGSGSGPERGGESVPEIVTVVVGVEFESVDIVLDMLDRDGVTPVLY